MLLRHAMLLWNCRTRAFRLQVASMDAPSLFKSLNPVEAKLPNSVYHISMRGQGVPIKAQAQGCCKANLHQCFFVQEVNSSVWSMNLTMLTNHHCASFLCFVLSWGQPVCHAYAYVRGWGGVGGGAICISPVFLLSMHFRGPFAPCLPLLAHNAMDFSGQLPEPFRAQQQQLAFCHAVCLGHRAPQSFCGHQTLCPDPNLVVSRGGPA